MLDDEDSGKGCYKIHHSEELGRYLVARRDIPPLEIIIQEKPLVCAPADDPKYEDLGRVPMCLGCFARITGNSKSAFCSKCKWPVCDGDCQMINHHASNECSFLEEFQVPFEALPFQGLLNESIFVLRCLLLKRRNPEAWTNILLKFEHHTAIRSRKPECVAKDAKLMANLKEIASHSSSAPWFDLEEEEVARVSGVLNVNAFSSTKLEDECRSRRVRRRVTICQCLYPTATLIAHQCVPNACWTISASPHFEQTIRSTVKIEKGTMISIAYAPQELMWPTLQRLISSNDVAHFVCQCRRCLDPTELNSFIGGVKCEACSPSSSEPPGFLLPENPINPDSDWRCRECLSSQGVTQVVKVVHRLERKFNRIKSSAFSNLVEVSELEELYAEGLDLLHPNHYLLLEISLRIVNRTGLSLFCLDLEDLQRFLFHCNSLLSVMAILSPGYCKARALVQFYCAQGMMVKGRKWLKAQPNRRPGVEELLRETHNLQKEAFMYFRAEDENDNKHRALKGFNQYVACLEEEMKECRKLLGIAS